MYRGLPGVLSAMASLECGWAIHYCQCCSMLYLVCIQCVYMCVPGLYTVCVYVCTWSVYSICACVYIILNGMVLIRYCYSELILAEF